MQLAAAGTRRRHFWRAVRRIGVLSVLDVSVLLAARSFLSAAREARWTSSWASALFPSGFMGGWASVSAVLVGLVFVGAYASEERWASPAVALKGVALGSGLAMWQSLDTLGVTWTVTRWGLVTILVGSALAGVRQVLGLAVVRHGLATHPRDRVVFVGDPQSRAGRTASRAILKRPGMHSLGWLSEEGGVQDYLGHPSAVWEVLCERGADTVVLCGNLPRRLFDTVIEASAVAGGGCSPCATEAPSWPASRGRSTVAASACSSSRSQPPKRVETS